MIADDIVVLLVVRQELVEVALAVQRVEAAHVERLADPFHRRRLPQQRSLAAVHHAADDVVLRIVVRRVGVLAHVEAGEAPHALEIFRIGRHRQGHPVEELKPFAVMLPVRQGAELLEVHSVDAGGHAFAGLRLGVLLDHPLVALHVHLHDLVARTQRVQLGPMIEVLERIVRDRRSRPSGRSTAGSRDRRSTSGRTRGQRARSPQGAAVPSAPTSAPPSANRSVTVDAGPVEAAGAARNRPRPRLPGARR